MAIPKNITREHILSAIEEINKMIEIPKSRKSRKYFLKHNNALYPPKYVISIAYKYAVGEELDPNLRVFTTYLAQDYLRDKGFKEIIVVGKST